MAYPTRKEKIFYVLVSPFVLAWTGLNFRWLATEGGIPVRDETGQVWANSGLQLWVTRVLYVILGFAAIVTLSAFVRGPLRRNRPE